MFKDTIYIGGRLVRSVESSVELSVLQSPYVYRTVRTMGHSVENVEAETDELHEAFCDVFGRSVNISSDDVSQAVTSVLSRNHYPQQMANAEVRLHAFEGRAVLCVVGGEVLTQSHYDSAVIRPAAKECTIEIPMPEHFTSFGRHVLSLTPTEAKEVRLLRRQGRLVSCEGFPLWGVIDSRVVSLTPWQSLESQRAEQAFARAGIPVERNAEIDEEKLCELFFFGTNELVSIGRAWGRALEPFVAFRLCDYLR